MISDQEGPIAEGTIPGSDSLHYTDESILDSKQEECLFWRTQLFSSRLASNYLQYQKSCQASFHTSVGIPSLLATIYILCMAPSIYGLRSGNEISLVESVMKRVHYANVLLVSCLGVLASILAWYQTRTYFLSAACNPFLLLVSLSVMAVDCGPYVCHPYENFPRSHEYADSLPMAILLVLPLLLSTILKEMRICAIAVPWVLSAISITASAVQFRSL